MRKGIFIAIEGIDGAGKTTLAHSIVTLFNKHGRQAMVTSEPTNGEHGQNIRKRKVSNIKDESKEFLLDRIEHYNAFIRPNLNKGIDIITDRYFYSNVAYQGTAFDKRTDAAIECLDEFEQYIYDINISYVPKPDYLIIALLPIEIALERIAHRSGSQLPYFETEQRLRCADKIFRYYANMSDNRIIPINTNCNTQEAISMVSLALSRQLS